MKNKLFYILIFMSFFGNAQETLEALLEKHNDVGVPYISAETLAMPETEAILFDAREPKEFEVSHLKTATCVGYDNFNINAIEKKYPNKNKKIVVYCSLGIRSETIGEKLKKAGYTNVYNLYGGIFEWKNKAFTVIDSEAKETEKVHTFNKDWSQWLKKGEKVYDEEVKTKKKKKRKQKKQK